MKTRKIALEEAFTAPSTAPYLDITLKVVPAEDRADFTKLLEDSDERIAAMDEAGIDIFVLSQTSPGVQAEKDAGVAARRAREANDYLKGQIERHPDRYGGFAHLPTQDVGAASDELERCVKELGFLGAMINGQTNGVYLDDERYLPFWERVAELGVPVYIHPADPYVQPHVLEGYAVMQGAVWGGRRTTPRTSCACSSAASSTASPNSRSSSVTWARRSRSSRGASTRATRRRATPKGPA